MKVNVEVIMSPEEYENAKETQRKYMPFDTIEEIVFDWINTDFVDYVNDFTIKVKEETNNG